MSKELVKAMAEVENTFLTMTKAALEGNLKSVILYGSAIKGGYTDGVSDINVLIILDNVDPDAIAALGKTADKVMRKNRINPLILTDEEFLGSADVFPMEYLDIQESRKILFGEDLPGKLTITSENLRHQVEEQLRGSIASVRRALLGTGGKEKQMGGILRDWFGSQAALFRGLLRLKKIASLPGNPEEGISLLGETFAVDVGGLSEAARLRQGEQVAPVSTAKRVLVCLTELAAQVDAMEG